MKRLLVFLAIFTLLLGTGHQAVNAADACDAYKGVAKVWWDGMELTKGQIGRLTVKADTPLYKLDGEQRTFSRTLKKGEFYRIYAFKPGLLSVGGGYYVVRDAKVTYQTPSKQKLTAAQCVNNRFVNLGPQIFNTNAITGATGYAPDGTALLYVLLQGEPATLVAMDIVHNTVWDQKILPKSTAAWSIDVDDSGNVWVGGTPTGDLYQYNPSVKKLTDIGKATAKGTSVHDLEAVGSGIVYGSTSPNGSVFRYQAGTFTDLGQVLAGKTLARSLAYNEETQTLFVGVGAKAQLVAWNLKTNKKQSILPAAYQSQTSVYDLDEEDGVLFAKLEPSKKILVFDSKTFKFIKELPAGSRGVSSVNAKDHAVYYTNDYYLRKYNLETGQTSTVLTGTLKGTEAVSIDVTDLHSKDYPESSVVGLLGNSGTFLIYNSATDKLIVNKLNLPPQPISIYTVKKGPSGKIYTNGFVSGQVSVYDPATKESKEILKVGQAESMTTLKGNLYLGVYPGANLFKYDPSLTPAGGKLAPLTTIGNGQERIVAMVADEKNNKLFMGTHPKNGEVGGAFVIFNPTTNSKTVRRNIVANQSVVSLTLSNGYVYGGTSIFANSSNEGTQTAVLFRLKATDPNGKMERIALPLTKPRMIHALVASGNGMIWGLSDGNLFVYDPKTKATKTINITPTTSGRFQNGSLVIGKDGMIYGTVEQKLFMVNPNTMQKTIYSGRKALDLTMDNDGNLYYTDGVNLWMLKA